MKILILLTTIFLIGCMSFETTLSTNFDFEGNTYELAMGYNREDDFNLLAFANIGYLWRTDPRVNFTLTYSFGIDFEKYFTDTVGISLRGGFRHKQYEMEYQNRVYVPSMWGPGWHRTNSERITYRYNNLFFQLGIPFSWSYGKITPFTGVVFQDEPRFNLGVRLALRNQAIRMFIIALGAAGQELDATPIVLSRNVATIHTRDREQERRNQEIAAAAILDIRGEIVEDRLPFPAWKWRPQYEGIHWEYRNGAIWRIE